MMEFVDFCEYDFLLFDVDFDEQGGLVEFVCVVDGVDVVIFGMLVYYGLYFGIFKNVFDYCGFDEFGEKIVGLFVVVGGLFFVIVFEYFWLVCWLLNLWVFFYQVVIFCVFLLFDGDDFVSEDLCEWVE